MKLFWPFDKLERAWAARGTILPPRRACADYWKLSHAQLAWKCREIGETNFAGAEPGLQAEAVHLYAGWMEAEAMPVGTEAQRSERQSVQAGLRKRTIEVLIKNAEAHQRPRRGLPAREVKQLPLSRGFGRLLLEETGEIYDADRSAKGL